MSRHPLAGIIADAVGSVTSIEGLLEVVAGAAREVVRAHQATTSVVLGRSWARAAHGISLSEKYAAWRTYDERPDGSGIYRLVCQTNRPLRLTQAQLEAHPAWRGFGPAARRHPPMRGWLAVPLTGRDGRNIGVLKVSDKEAGDFSAADEAALTELARLASVALARVRRSARAERRAARRGP